MIKIKVDSNTFLVVDFEGLLSPREEEVTAWRFSGKSKGAVSVITGTSIDTVSKQQKKAYEKTQVAGADSPLALMMCKAFQNGWARFVVSLMIFLCLMPCVRVQLRSSARVSASIIARSGLNRTSLTYTG